MAGQGHGHGHGQGVTYKGLTLHPPSKWHSWGGKIMCTIMWLWIFHRAKEDGPVFLGLRHPWEGHEHGHGHGHGVEKEHEDH